MMRVVISGVLVLLCSAGHLTAQELTGNVTLSSDYVFRGISQTNGDPAVQGGFDFSHGSFYIGTWASNIDFGGPGSIEADVYLGFSGETETLGWDVGVLQYIYPSQSDLDFTEIYAGITFGGLGLKASYSDDFAGIGEEGTYLDLSYEVEIGERASVVIGGGYSTFGGDSLVDYYDYRLGVNFVLPKDLTLGLVYTDTDLPDSDPLADLADGRISISLSKDL